MKPALNEYEQLISGDPKAEQAFAKLLRRKRRELRAKDPAGHRKLRKLSDRELDQLYANTLERVIRQLRFAPNFANDPEAQARVAQYEYELRLAGDLEALRNAPRKSRTRYIPRPALAGIVPAPPLPPLPPSPANAPPSSTTAADSPVPPPKPDNVVPIRPDMSWCQGKAFGIGEETRWTAGED